MNHTIYNPGGMRQRNGSPAMPMPRMETNTAQLPENGVCGGCSDLEGRALAMAYIPVQHLGEMYEPCAALIAGTLFPALDKPFCGKTVSASAYPTAPARTCTDPSCGCTSGACTRTTVMRGGVRRG